MIPEFPVVKALLHYLLVLAKNLISVFLRIVYFSVSRHRRSSASSPVRGARHHPSMTSSAPAAAPAAAATAASLCGVAAAGGPSPSVT